MTLENELLFLPNAGKHSPSIMICKFSDYVHTYALTYRGKGVPLQAWSGPECSRFPDYVTTAQGGGRLLALRTGCLHPQEILLVFFSVTA